MASNTQNIQKFWRNLRDSGKSILQCGALIYIRCNAEKLDTTSVLNEEEYVEVCRLVMEIFINGEPNASKEAAKTLPVILKYLRKYSLRFFESALHVDRDKRPKIFKFLESLDDSCFVAAIEDPSTLDFIEDSLSSVQTSSMEWLSSTSCTENITMLQEVENKALSGAEELEEIIVNNVLVLLRRCYKTAITIADIQSVEKFDTIVMEKVVTLAYLGHKRQRSPAIRLVDQAIEADLTMRLKTKHSEIYQRYKKNIQGHYSTRMMLLVKACETDWSRLWSISIRILGTDLHRGALLINKLLGVEERAFKSNDPIVRREAFVSWKLLIDNLAIDMKELATQRRVRLLCVPLTANNSKSELIALKKLEIWWYLIVKLYPNILPFVDPVVTQFLNFCFGPLGDTPLLSKKFDVIASPGKRFFKSKIYSIDALLQLIVQDQKDRKMMAPILDERLPNSISDALFAQCYKTFLHSIGEAVYMISKFDRSEMTIGEEICKLLWINLMHYVRKTSVEPKTNVYNELIVVISELQICSMEIDFLDNFLRDVIVPELSASANDLMYYDNTLVDLMTKIMVPKFLKNLRGKQCDAVKCLMWQTTRPEESTKYHPQTLRFLEATLQQLQSVPLENDSSTDCFDLWFVYAEIAYKFMKALQDVNEGNATEMNFKTIDSIISFPFTHMYWANSIQAQKIAIHWKDVYKKYECQADTVTSIKPNEIFDNTTKMIEACLAKNEKCYRIAVYCLDALMGTINYKFLLAQNDVPTIVRIVSDLTTIALHGGQTTEAECALKALSSLLITVYGHSPEKVLSYMNFTSQTIELMLKTDADDSLIKEISSTWETIVSILRGLSSLLDEKFLESYKQVLLLSLRHDKTEITSQALSILELKDNISENARGILAELSRVYKKSLGKDATKAKIDKADRTPKSPRMAGSFLNRQVQSPRTLSIREKQDIEKKVTPVLPDPDSQDYVVIRSEVRLDVNRLTEHQKESLKRRRDDIPALYNDLSQSSSQDTQDLQAWFAGKKKIDDSPTPLIDDEKSPRVEEKTVKDRKIGKIAEDPRVGKMMESPMPDKNTSKSMETENTVAAVIQRGETVASSGQDPTSESALLGESSRTDEMQKSFGNSEGQTPQEKTTGRNEPTPASDDSYVKETKSPDADPSCNDQTSVIVKKLNFESRDEYPDEEGKEREESSSSDAASSNKTNRRGNTKTGETNSTPIATRGATKNRGKAGETEGERTSLENAEIPAGTPEKSRDAMKTRGNTSRVPMPANNTERGTKRKAASDGENEDNSEREKKRKISIKSSSCTVEDSETTALSQATKRTGIEMSRLRIDMVSDGPLTSRRRTKYSDDNANSQTNVKKSNLPDGKGPRHRGLRSRAVGNSRRSSKTPEKDDTMKKSRKRVATVQDNERVDAKKKENADNQTAKSLRSRSRRKMNLRESGAASESQTIIDDEDTTNESVCSNRDSDKSIDSTKSNIENSDNPVEENLPPDASLSPVVEATDAVADFDLDEVVESSQDSTVLTGSHKRSFSKIVKLKSPEETELPIVVPVESSIENKQPTSSSPIIPSSSHAIAAPEDDEGNVTNDDRDETFLDISAIRPQLADDVPIEDTEKKTPEASKTMASPVSIPKAPEANFNFSSPKGHTKRFAKPKSFASQGRAAHMLGLVTKLATLEKDGQVDKNQVDEEIATIKRSRTKEIDGEIASAKRDRANVIREPERIGSPSGSRQEKIFNNMKSADYAASPPGKLFGNLRNNGEKISPKMEKSQAACQDNGNSSGFKDDECNVSPTNDKDELPMLEWSSANPPSLTASPSASILKRNRSIVNETDPEPTTPNRIPNKRVSFADPPVSKEMGYEIEKTGSPHKIVKFSSTRPLSARKDSPIRTKQSRFVTIQMDIEKPDREADAQPVGCDIDLNISDKENSEMLLKITGDLENIGNSQNSGKIGSPVLNASEKSLIANIIGCEPIENENWMKICDDIGGKSSECLKHVPIEEAPTQDDLFNSSDEKIDSPNKNSDRGKDVAKDRVNLSEQSSVLESFKLNVTDDSVIGSITDLPREETSVPDSLEDTIDVRNITSLNLTGNTDDSFGEIPVRTSTQAPDPMNEMDTLPVADSMSSSLPPMSQDSQGSSQATVEIPRPESLNSTDAIYPNLDECQRPIEDIIDNLTNPLWRKNLTKHLETRCIRTVGDLARLSEREIVRIPFKGSSKINFVREVLRKFERKLRISSFDDKSHDDIVESERLASSMNNETIEVTQDQDNDELPREIRKSLGDISALVSIAKFSDDSASLDSSRLESLAAHDFPSVENLNPEVLVPLGRTSTANSISTIIVDSSTEPEVYSIHDRTKNVSEIPTINLSSDLTQITTRSVGTLTDPPAETSNKSAQSQVKLDELLDEIDVDILLRSAVKRTTADKLLTEYKLKMEGRSEMELCKETLRILEISNDALLKLACHECGVKKVLCELPNIFYSDDSNR